MPEKRKFDMRSHIDSQKSLFTAIKAANTLTLNVPLGDEYESIADKVRARQGITDDEMIGLAVAIGSLVDNEGEYAGDELWVQVTKADPERPGKPVITQTRIASVFEGAVLPRDGFVDEEAVAVNGMIAGLKEAKRIGVLINLNDGLTEINDPTTLLMMLPPVETSPQE